MLTDSYGRRIRDLRVSLTDRCPDDFSADSRIIEILDGNESVKESGRQRYRRYQQAGLTISTHPL